MYSRDLLYNAAYSKYPDDGLIQVEILNVDHHFAYVAEGVGPSHL